MDDPRTYPRPSETEVAEAKRLFDLTDLPKADFTNHQWRQMGNRLMCNSCELPHMQHIDIGKQLYGIDANGNPMIRDVVVH